MRDDRERKPVRSATRTRAPRSQESGAALRRRAEAMVDLSAADILAMPGEQVQRLVYELQVHQVELELQNEELRQVQMELAASRDRYLDLYEFAPVGYVTLTRQGAIVEANLTAAALLGLDRNKLLGKHFSDFIAPAVQDKAHLYWRRVFSVAQRQVGEIELRTTDGESRTVRLESVVEIHPGAGEPRCHVAVVDTSDLKAARDELAKLNQSLEQRVSAQVAELRLLGQAIASLGEGVLITTDHDDWAGSTIVFANQAMSRILGYSREELIDSTPAQFIVEDASTSISIPQLQDEIAHNYGFLGEVVYRTKDGAHREIDLCISPLYDAHKQCANYVAIHRDVTTQKQDQRALEVNQRQMAAVFDTASDSIISIDYTGIIRNCNGVVEKMFGYSVTELVGNNVTLLVPPYAGEENVGYFRSFLDTPESKASGHGREFRALHREGHTFPIALRVSEVESLGIFIGFIHDLTQVRKLQHQVLSAAGEVQSRIGQALHDGPQQALAGLSLLSRGLALDLERTLSPYVEEAQKLSEGLKLANRNIRALARGLVSVRIGSGGLKPALARLAQQTNDSEGLRCEFECPDSIYIEDNFIVDQLFHIAQEATLNAIKHSGGDYIRILLERQESGIRLSVTDNGKGISRPRDNSTGLGLHIMPYRAGSIGGELMITDAEGGGTVVVCKMFYAQDISHA